MSNSVLYARCSSEDQNTDRQLVNASNYDHVIEDHCSGSIDLWERPGGRKLLKLIEEGLVGDLYIHQLDRLGRSVQSILSNLEFCTKRTINVHFITQGLSTLNADGTENPVSLMVISMLSVLAQMEKNLILQRQKEGITLAKLRGVYKGRQQGTREDVATFLGKKKNREILAYLKKNYKHVDIAELCGVHVNTVTKVKRLGLCN